MLCESGQVRLRTCLCCIWVNRSRITLCILCDFVCLADDQVFVTEGHGVVCARLTLICCVFVLDLACLFDHGSDQRKYPHFMRDDSL